MTVLAEAVNTLSTALLPYPHFDLTMEATVHPVSINSN